MHAVVNRLTFREPVDADQLARAAELTPAMRAIEGFRGFHVVQVDATGVVLVILGDSPEVLDRIATEVGSPWMMANVVPLLAGPPQREVGPVLASSEV